MKTDRIITIGRQHIADLIDPQLGATVIHNVGYPKEGLVAEMTKLLPDFKTPPQGKLVSNYEFYCLPVVGNIWAEFAALVAADLNDQLGDVLGTRNAFEFDDLYLTRYAEPESGSAIGVGAHRDTNCKGIVAVFILKGELPFVVCPEGREYVPLPVCPGELLLMRADDCGQLPRPLHFVGEIGRRSVIQFGMRQYIEKKK